MTFSIMTLSIKSLYMTLIKNDTALLTFSITMLCIILSFIMLNVVMMSVIVLDVVMLNVVEPKYLI
jgi:hypothetical protein